MKSDPDRRQNVAAPHHFSHNWSFFSNNLAGKTDSDTTKVSLWFEQQLEDENRKSVDLPSKLFAIDSHLAGSNVTLSLRLPSQHLVLSEKESDSEYSVLWWTRKYFFRIWIHG